MPVCPIASSTSSVVGALSTGRRRAEYDRLLVARSARVAGAHLEVTPSDVRPVEQPGKTRLRGSGVVLVWQGRLERRSAAWRRRSGRRFRGGDAEPPRRRGKALPDGRVNRW